MLDLILQEAQGLKAENEYNEDAKIETGHSKVRKAGLYRGQIWMADDFDAPLSEFKEYM